MAEAQMREEAWLLYFEDAGVRPEIFTGADAELQARTRYADANHRWACHLFRAARPAAETPVSLAAVEQHYKDTGNPYALAMLAGADAAQAEPTTPAEIQAEIGRLRARIHLLALRITGDPVAGIGLLAEPAPAEGAPPAQDEKAAARAAFGKSEWVGYDWEPFFGGWLARAARPAAETPQPDAQVEHLPPLPEPDGYVAFKPTGSVIIPPQDFGKHDGAYKIFTADQMRAYARAAIEQRVGQEPVAWIEHHKGGDNLVWDDPGGKKTPLYAAPAPVVPPAKP